MNTLRPATTVAQWGRFDQALTSTTRYLNPVQEAHLTGTFTSPSGKEHVVDGFWDGATTWRVRLMPDEQGEWRFVTGCSDQSDEGLHGRSGTFWCGPGETTNRFGKHGNVRVAPDGHYLEHSDGTPFFWLADTGWNGPLLSSDDEWENYLRERVRQHFDAVQVVAMQFIAAPYGDRDGQMAFSGHESVSVNAAFFRRMDAKLDAINRAGLLAVPTLIWAAHWSSAEVNATNPGLVLPQDQCILLARYMVARWGAHHVAWILPGDAVYQGENAERWKRIGRAVFGDREHAPVTLHPGGRHWYGTEFRREGWLDFISLQSSHSGDDVTHAWILTGEATTEWATKPVKPIINVEPNYEYHLDQKNLSHRFDAFDVRRAVYWSLLVMPTAGVTYGGHGVWGWDDGTRLPTNHPTTGMALPWREALAMPGAEQMAHVDRFFRALPWWQLRPAPELLLAQPGDQSIGRTIVAARSESGDLAVFYTPGGDPIELDIPALGPGLHAAWYDPRTSAWIAADFTTPMKPPTIDDWVLVLHTDRLKTTQH